MQPTLYFDNSPGNENVVDPRNWSGLGHRSIDSRLPMIGRAVFLTDEQFANEVARRRTTLGCGTGRRRRDARCARSAACPGGRLRRSAAQASRSRSPVGDRSRLTASEEATTVHRDVAHREGGGRFQRW
jgi:hypothetical protein